MKASASLQFVSSNALLYSCLGNGWREWSVDIFNIVCGCMIELDLRIELPGGRDENAFTSKAKEHTHDLVTYLKFVTECHTKMYLIPQPQNVPIGVP